MTYHSPARVNEGRGLAIGGIVLAAIGLVVFGIVLGPVGALMGYVGTRRGERTLGWVAVALGAVAFVLSIAAAAYLRTLLQR